jgi:spermidine synthase
MAMFNVTSTDFHLYFSECCCDEKLLKNGRSAVEVLVNAVKEADLTVVETCYKEFNHGGSMAGITAAILLLESHLVIHSWPERENTVICDISVCNYFQDNSPKAKRLQELLEDIFSPKKKLIHTSFNPLLTENTKPKEEDLDGTTILNIENVLFQKRSSYQDIAVVESKNFGNVLILDSFFQTSEKDEFLYHEALVHVPMITHEAPKEVLIVGGGDGGSAEEVLKHPSVKSCTLAEIDKEVIDVSRKYLSTIHKNCFDNKRMQIYMENGIDFIKRTDGLYDIIILDITDPLGASPPLYTEDFYNAAKERLFPGGLISLHFGTVSYDPRQAGRIFSSLSGIFGKVKPYLNYVPLYGGIMGFVLCGESFEILQVEEVAERLRERDLPNLKLLNPQVYQGLFAIPNFIKDILEGPST